jgi:hypothetical protein
MPIKIIADTRELLIDIFFAIIIAVGFENFVQHFILTEVLKSSSDLFSLTSKFSTTGILIDTLFFFASYFWVISHWVFYHDLIEKYPYYNWWKFFVDISLFSIMFLIVNISYSVYSTNQINNAIASLFILLLAIWYLLSCLWHLADRKLRPLRRYLHRHIKRIVTYAVLFVLLYVPLATGQIIPWYQNAIMMGVIVAMIVWNIHRLSKFLKRDLREYRLVDISGNIRGPKLEKLIGGIGGTLRLEKYPMRKEKGHMPDKIIFVPNKIDRNSKRPSDLCISPEVITRVKTIEEEGDLMIEITYGSSSKLLLNLDDRVIEGVEKGLKQLYWINRKRNVT